MLNYQEVHQNNIVVDGGRIPWPSQYVESLGALGALRCRHRLCSSIHGIRWKTVDALSGWWYTYLKNIKHHQLHFAERSSHGPSLKKLKKHCSYSMGIGKIPRSHSKIPLVDDWKTIGGIVAGLITPYHLDREILGCGYIHIVRRSYRYVISIQMIVC